MQGIDGMAKVQEKNQMAIMLAHKEDLNIYLEKESCLWKDIASRLLLWLDKGETPGEDELQDLRLALVTHRPEEPKLVRCFFTGS